MNEPYPYFGALPCRERDEQERMVVADRFRDANCETILTEDSAAAIIALANYRRIKFFLQCEPWEIFPAADKATIPRFSAPILKSLAQLSELMPAHTPSTLIQMVLEKHEERTARTGARKEKVRYQPSNKNNKWAHNAPRSGITTGDIVAAILSLQRLDREKEDHHDHEIVYTRTTRSSARNRGLPATTQSSKRAADVAEQHAAPQVDKRRRQESMNIELPRSGIRGQDTVSPIASPTRTNAPVPRNDGLEATPRDIEMELDGIIFPNDEDVPIIENTSTTPIMDTTPRSASLPPEETSPSLRLSGKGLSRAPLINLITHTPVSTRSGGGNTPANRVQTGIKTTRSSGNSKPTRSGRSEEDSSSSSNSDEESDDEHRSRRNVGQDDVEKAGDWSIAAKCAQYGAEIERIRNDARQVLSDSQTSSLELNDLILHGREAQLRLSKAILERFPALQPRIAKVESRLQGLLSRAENTEQTVANEIQTAQDERKDADADLKATLQSPLALALAANDQRAVQAILCFQTELTEAQAFIDHHADTRRKRLKELELDLTRLDTSKKEAASDKGIVADLVKQIKAMKEYVKDALPQAKMDKDYYENNRWRHRGI